MQPTSRVAGGFEKANNGSAEPPDVFCGLASLIVEGRLPRNDTRGYGEGPHVPQTGSKALSLRHECIDENNMCKKDENFRKHMLLLWQNNVPVSIEVLLCSNCRVSQQKVRSVEFSTIPEPGSILLEQWTVSIQAIQRKDQQDQHHLISSQGLYQAVRSYLHFSQLSAWYASTRGQQPQNVLYRITIPGEAFASKFSCKPEEHFFPAANVGWMSSVHVTVRSLPRCDDIPRVICPHSSALLAQPLLGSSHPVMTLPELSLSPIASSGAASSASSSSPPSTSSPEDEAKLSMATGVDYKDLETDLRISLARSRFVANQECQEKLPRSDSMDSMLGDSLLDPPQSLQKIPPKRYQSPSRCGSPSLEAPDHLLFRGSSTTATSAENNNQSRLARQDLLRRRDINLYTGLHPRLLHGHQPQVSPRLSLFSSTSHKPPYNQTSRTPCRVFPATANPPQMPSPASFQTQNLTSTSSASTSETDQDQYEGVNLGAKQKKQFTKTNDDDLDEDLDGEAEDGLLPADFAALQIDVSDSKCSSRRSSLKDEDCLFPHKCKKKNNSSVLEDIFGIQPESGIFSDDSIRVYRAEIPPLPSSTTKPDQVQVEQPKSDHLLGAILNHRHLDNNINNSRIRSFSETVNNHPIEPLDLSFDTSKDWSDDEASASEEEDEVANTSRRSSFSADNYVPTPDECASFRQSFDSATSMVFHRKTGLPLTSSPAPLRKNSDKFDFDDSITSPHDIKKALFAKKSLFKKIIREEDKENLEKALVEAKNLEAVSIETPSPRRETLKTLLETKDLPSTKKTLTSSSVIVGTKNKRRERRPSKKLLSASAPATLTSNNLLGNFEESVLNGRLEPNSTVEGFTAEIGASGSFQPKHKTLPVTVFFYTLCDNAAYSSPYLGHINLGKKGYRVPPKGTIQVTLFNPLGTVVKMFVVMYDLSDMPPNSQTFLRQRTLYMPSEGVNDAELQKWLRYLVHLRFASSNTGKIYLHTDIRMIIFRKSDLDTAADFTSSKGFELRSFTQGPANPKFSPRR